MHFKKTAELDGESSCYYSPWFLKINSQDSLRKWRRQTPVTFVIGQQIEESLSNFLPCERLSVLEAVQQRADGVILSLSVHCSHSVPVRKLTFTEEVQDVPLDGNRNPLYDFWSCLLLKTWLYTLICSWKSIKFWWLDHINRQLHLLNDAIDIKPTKYL